MKGLQWNKSQSTLKMVEAPVPEVKPETVLLKVSHCGVCGTDLHIMQHEFRSGQLVILGHEFSGTIVKVGTGVNNVAVGDKVVVEPNSMCDTCRFCRRGRPNCCQKCLPEAIGCMKDGGMAEFCLIPAKYVVKFPEALPMDKAALVEPMACVIHGYEILGQIPDGTRMLVMGSGIIGLLWIHMLHYRGFRDVTVVEVSEGRRQIVSNSGLGYRVLHPNDLQVEFKNANMGEDGFDIVVDCTGNPRALEMAYGLLCSGATLLVFGCPPSKSKLTIDPSLIQTRELKILGVNVSPYCFIKAVSLVNDMAVKYLNFDKLGIKKYSLEQYETALTELKAGNISKAMFCIDN
ncbi:hypothetical protein LOTGIDRAFT_188066 [Lottia gigantea]|uniref:Enoyl reductase (ER) domain-containing protein n=1 Tax=Lottia gigantea TaxID=225164 RepID=V4AIZ7_LOTGI|nr:hypothetical protein LOTGIDRAFT_188066 [Lottia gigantea]ESO97022.1 hypothetical protein LOTGIDRAFT_188066 [Lottia gigantea]